MAATLLGQDTGTTPQMAADLRDLIERSKRHRMTPEERFQQKVSFVWGNLPHNSKVSKKQVEERLAKREGRR